MRACGFWTFLSKSSDDALKVVRPETRRTHKWDTPFQSVAGFSRLKCGNLPLKGNVAKTGGI